MARPGHAGDTLICVLLIALLTVAGTMFFGKSSLAWPLLDLQAYLVHAVFGTSAAGRIAAIVLSVLVLGGLVHAAVRCLGYGFARRRAERPVQTRSGGRALLELGICVAAIVLLWYYSV